MKKFDVLAGANGPEIKKTILGGVASVLAVLFSIWILNREYQNFR